MIEYSLSEQTEIPAGGNLSVKVVGVGGAGANVLDRMALEGSEEAELLTLNTDVRALSTSVSNNKVQLGATLLKGMGAGGDPELGRQAALEAIDDIRAAVRGYQMVFVCVGLGGGTGSGAAPEVCRVAKEEGVFLVVFATLPFTFEGKRRMDQALESLDRISKYANAVITFENDRMGELIVPKDGVQQAFAAGDKVISQSIRATMGVVTKPGIIRIGMDDLLSALDNRNSRCLFGFGQAKGENRALEALEHAFKSPLLDKGKLLEKATNVLVHVGGGDSMTLFEVELVMHELAKHIDDSRTQILFGTGTDKKLGSSLTVTVISSLEGPARAGIGDSTAAARIGESPAIPAAPETEPPGEKAEEELSSPAMVEAALPPKSVSPLAGAAEALKAAADAEEVAEIEEAVEEEAEEAVEELAEEVAAVEEAVEEAAEEAAEELVEEVAEIEEAVEKAAEESGEDLTEEVAEIEETIEEAAEETVEELAEEVTGIEEAVEEAAEETAAELTGEEKSTGPLINPQIVRKKVVETKPSKKSVVEVPRKKGPQIKVAGPGKPAKKAETPQASPPRKLQPPEEEEDDSGGSWSNLESPDTIGKLLQQGKKANEAGEEAAGAVEDSEAKVSIRDLARKSREEIAAAEAQEEISPGEEQVVVAETEDAQKITLSRLVPGAAEEKKSVVSGKPKKKRAVADAAVADDAVDAEEEEGDVDEATAKSQQMLQLEPLAKGRFAKTEPNIVDGEDMDVPTFLRKRRK